MIVYDPPEEEIQFICIWEYNNLIWSYVCKIEEGIWYYFNNSATDEDDEWLEMDDIRTWPSNLKNIRYIIM